METTLNSIDDVNGQLSSLEHILLSNDTMSSDRESLRSLQNQLKVTLESFNPLIHLLLYADHCD